MLLGEFDKIIRSHYFKILVWESKFCLICNWFFSIFEIRSDREKQYTVWPALLQTVRLNMNKMKRLESKLRNLLIFFELYREWPSRRIHRLIISLPKLIHDLQIRKTRFIEDGSTMIGVIRNIVKVRRCRNGIDIVILPNTIF